MNKTLIEWVKNPDGTQGYTWNPITGCLNGCPYCYARKLANGRLKSRYLANHLVTVSIEKMWEHNPDTNPFYPRFWEDRFVSADNFLKASKKPLGIFPCDMSDWCGIGIPHEWSNMVYSFMVMHKRHRFYLLTKQPQNLIKFSPFPDNCWVGVTATNFEMFGPAVYYLSSIEAKIKYISFEPLLDKILSIHDGGYNVTLMAHDLKKYIDSVIIGAQTKPYKPPAISWVEEIVRACDKASVPVFLKDNLDLIIPWDGIFRVKYAGALRQEMPE